MHVRQLGWNEESRNGLWYVSDVDPAGAAAELLQPGDNLVSLNGDRYVGRAGTMAYRRTLQGVRLIGSRFCAMGGSTSQGSRWQPPPAACVANWVVRDRLRLVHRGAVHRFHAARTAGRPPGTSRRNGHWTGFHADRAPSRGYSCCGRRSTLFSATTSSIGSLPALPSRASLEGAAVAALCGRRFCERHAAADQLDVRDAGRRGVTAIWR